MCKLKQLRTLLLLISAVALLSGCQPKEITSAKIYISNGEWDKALAQLELAAKNYPNNAEAHFLLGKAYGNREQFEGMKKEFNISLQISDKFQQEILAEQERHWIETYNDGLTALNEKRYEEAEDVLKTAIKIDSFKPEAYKKLALTYINTNQPDKALVVYNKLLERHPDDVDLLSSIANLYYTKKEYPQAVEILKRILQIDPEHRDALANLALSYDSMGKMEEAHQAFENAVRANPADKDLIFVYGVHHFKMKQYAQAIQLFERVIEMDPDDFEAISNIGNAYLSMAEDLRQELKNLNSNGTHSTEDIQKIRNQAILNYKKAIPYLEQALELRPNHPTLWQNLGVAYINTGEKEKGQQAFLKAEDMKIQLSN